MQTVAVVGYAAGGLGGGLLAAARRVRPSFAFILIGAERFDRLRANPSVRAFLDGAGPAAIGAIAGAAIPLALALTETWQFARPRRRRRRALRRCGAASSRRCSPRAPRAPWPRRWAAPLPS